jgi:hypothetical protein
MNSAEAEYQSWLAELRSSLGPALPACPKCNGAGSYVEDGTDWHCGDCNGSGVHMVEHEFTGQPGWKLHDCPDGAKCRTEIGGGCASGWCAHFGVESETPYRNFIKIGELNG